MIQLISKENLSKYNIKYIIENKSSKFEGFVEYTNIQLINMFLFNYNQFVYVYSPKIIRLVLYSLFLNFSDKDLTNFFDISDLSPRYNNYLILFIFKILNSFGFFLVNNEVNLVGFNTEFKNEIIEELKNIRSKNSENDSLKVKKMFTYINKLAKDESLKDIINQISKHFNDLVDYDL